MTLPNMMVAKLVAGIACALALAILIHDRNRWKGVAAVRQEQVVAEKAAHLATVANYRAAAEAAREADAEAAARIRRDQALINERTAHDFETRIADARARAASLAARRLQQPKPGAAADPGAGGAAPMPGLSAAPGRAPQAAGEDRLPDRLIATEQAIQLDELIRWVRQQAGVKRD